MAMLASDYLTIGYGLMPTIAGFISMMLIILNACQYLIALED
jgi:hypothetical protein